MPSSTLIYQHCRLFRLTANINTSISRHLPHCLTPARPYMFPNCTYGPLYWNAHAHTTRTSGIVPAGQPDTRRQRPKRHFGSLWAKICSNSPLAGAVRRAELSTTLLTLGPRARNGSPAPFAVRTQTDHRTGTLPARAWSERAVLMSCDGLGTRGTPFPRRSLVRAPRAHSAGEQRRPNG